MKQKSLIGRIGLGIGAVLSILMPYGCASTQSKIMPEDFYKGLAKANSSSPSNPCTDLYFNLTHKYLNGEFPGENHNRYGHEIRKQNKPLHELDNAILDHSFKTDASILDGIFQASDECSQAINQ